MRCRVSLLGSFVSCSRGFAVATSSLSDPPKKAMKLTDFGYFQEFVVKLNLLRGLTSHDLRSPSLPIAGFAWAEVWKERDIDLGFGRVPCI